MKKYLISLVCILSISILTSCSIFTANGRAVKKEATGRSKIVNTEARIAANVADKLDAVATLAYGTDYALSKVNEPPKEVSVARDMNQRVMSLAGSPSIDKIKEMQVTIDDLTSKLATEQETGKKRLNDKDDEIASLQAQTKVLDQERDIEIKKYMQIAQDAAAVSDAYKNQLNKMDEWLGLGAVFYGLKKFFISSMWILGIGSVLFLVLRFASMSNPIAGAIFSIFNIFGSWVVHAIQAIFPKALELAGNTATEVFNTYKSTMKKIIDGIQTLKERQAATGDPNKKFTLDELMDELSKTMGDNDKKLVTEIKREIGYH